ncbi:S1C family serine protease, partial [Enterococcus faecium]
MDRKNVTPKMKKNKNNSLWRKLGLGLVGGIVGGLLTAGIFYAAMGTGNN